MWRQLAQLGFGAVVFFRWMFARDMFACRWIFQSNPKSSTEIQCTSIG